MSRFTLPKNYSTRLNMTLATKLFIQVQRKPVPNPKQWDKLRAAVLAVSIMLSCAICGAQGLKVENNPPVIAKSTWDQLTASEQYELLARFTNVEIMSPSTVGLIETSQVANRSTAGTNSGAALGGAVGQAAYIDRSLGGGNYSALTQLGVGIAGAVIGSSLDTPQPEFAT